MFSLEQLLFAIANDQRSKDDTIKKILPMLKEAFEAEKTNRQALKVNIKNKLIKILMINIFYRLQDAGVNATEKIHEMKNKVNAEELECNYCRANLHISWIKLENGEDDAEDENNVYCLKHALKYLNDNRIEANRCKLIFTYTTDEIEKLIKKLRGKIIQTDNDNAGHSSGTTNNKGKSNQKGRN